MREAGDTAFVVAPKQQLEQLDVTLAIKTRLDPYATERRRHSRVDICLTGQFMRENRLEFPCKTIDISPGGIAFAADAEVGLGERIIAYLAQIGRVEGIVRRQFPGGFAISMNLPAMKRGKLADQLTWLANRQGLGMPEDRRHERIAPRDRHNTLTLPNGREILCKIIDISRSGAAINATPAPAIGSTVRLGRTHGQVVREFTGGVAVEFDRVITEEVFGPEYRP